MSDTIKIDGDKFVEMQSEITRLRSLIQRMETIGDELEDWIDHGEGCEVYRRRGEKCDCGYEELFARWQELKKELEG